MVFLHSGVELRHWRDSILRGVAGAVGVPSWVCAGVDCAVQQGHGVRGAGRAEDERLPEGKVAEGVRAWLCAVVARKFNLELVPS